MSGLAVEIDGLVVRRGRREILRLPRLEILRGELSSVLGANGAGKSTLIKCLLGLVRPTSGRVRTLDCAVWPSPDGLYKLRRRIGYVPQVAAADGQTPLVVREVVAIGRTAVAGLFRPLGREDWNIVDQWLERLGLGSLAGRAFSELSGGEQRKTLIAKAMVQQPEILLLDEPAAHLDPYWREQIVATLESLHGAGELTIIMACHEVDVIPRGCRRLLALDKGMLVADGEPNKILSPDLLEQVYGLRMNVIGGGGRFAAAPCGEEGK
jgi:ABC-type cobalamin/Fe3+-siderophores transport system ATPase subunit